MSADQGLAVQYIAIDALRGRRGVPSRLASVTAKFGALRDDREHDPETVKALRSIWAAGLAALAGLPFLLIASLLIGAPIAGPAAIGCGYLAVALVHAGHRPRAAALIGFLVLLCLVGWSVLPFLGDQGPSLAGWTTALLAPLVAATPALARASLTLRANSKLATHRPTAGEASPQCPRPSVPAETLARADHAEERVPQLAGHAPVLAAVSTSAPISAGRPLASDVGDAVAFAVRCAGQGAETKCIRLETEIADSIAVACDRQVLRRILCALTECAVMRAPFGAAAHLSARPVKRVLLLRIVYGRAVGQGKANSHATPELSAARTMIEQAGGTIFEDETDAGSRISVRLDLAGVCET